MSWLLPALFALSAFAAKTECPDQLLTDLRLTSLLPMENGESSFANFDARGVRRAQALRIAKMFADMFYDRSTGLWLFGPSGSGKTHLAVAIARELNQKNLNVLYLSPETQTRFRRREPVQVAMQLVKDQALAAWLEERHRSHGRFDLVETEEALGEFDVILVDMVSLSESVGAIQFRELLREILMYAHRIGTKRLIVTSTVSLRQYERGLKASDGDDAAIVIDRLRDVFHPVQLFGPSYRAAGWFNMPATAPADPRSSPSSPAGKRRR